MTVKPESKLGWKLMMVYVDRKFKAIDPDDSKRKTIAVYDVTFGGDVWVYRRSYGRELWSQDKFLAFVENSTEIRP